MNKPRVPKYHFVHTYEKVTADNNEVPITKNAPLRCQRINNVKPTLLNNADAAQMLVAYILHVSSTQNRSTTQTMAVTTFNANAKFKYTLSIPIRSLLSTVVLYSSCFCAIPEKCRYELLYLLP